MNVILNGYAVNDPSTSTYLDVEIDGLELPSIRTSSGNYSGRNGGYVGSQFYSPRDIALQGNVFSSDIGTLETARQALQTALASQTVTMQVLTNAGHSYLIYCNLIDLKMPISRDLFSAAFKIELLAPDPIIYDNTSGGSLTANLPRLVSGGYVYPVVFPVIYTGGGSPTTVNNSGPVAIYPLITLTGIMTNPVLTNITTGQSFTLTGLITGSADVVIIDMRQRTVTLNGSSIFGDIGPNSTFWSLLSGNNSITLTTPSGTDTVTGVISWLPGRMGI